MIEPIHIPILMKAIDFVFDQGRKILEERRERRKVNNASQDSKNQEPAEEAAAPEVQEGNEVKQDLLASKIDEILWQNHEWEVERLVKQLEIHSTNYHIAKEQYAKWGSALVPPIIIHNMTEAENSMVDTIKRLEAILSKVYKKEIHAIK